jgi:hypothetical protein
MAVASILTSMGMMLLPPAIISLPFKLIFFVLVDGRSPARWWKAASTAPRRVERSDRNSGTQTIVPFPVVRAHYTYIGNDPAEINRNRHRDSK